MPTHSLCDEETKAHEETIEASDLYTRQLSYRTADRAMRPIWVL